MVYTNTRVERVNDSGKLVCCRIIALDTMEECADAGAFGDAKEVHRYVDSKVI